MKILNNKLHLWKIMMNLLKHLKVIITKRLLMKLKKKQILLYHKNYDNLRKYNLNQNKMKIILISINSL